MNNIKQILKISEAFLSRDLWGNVLSFLNSNCAKFESDNNTIDQFNCFLHFQDIFNNEFNNIVNNVLEVDYDIVEKIFLEYIIKGNRQIKVIIKTIQDLYDFNEFKKQMRRISIMVEHSVSEAMRAIREQSSDGDDEFALNAIEILEKSEEKALQKIIDEKVDDINSKLCIDDLKNEIEKLSKSQQTLKPTNNLNSSLLTANSIKRQGALSNLADKKLILSPVLDQLKKSQLGTPKPLIMRPGIVRGRHSVLGHIR